MNLGQKIISLKNPKKRTFLKRRIRARKTFLWNSLANKKSSLVNIAHREIGRGQPVFIIAEIGVNHDGDVEKAKRLIDAAVEAGADAVKFQKRDLYSAYRRDVVDHPERYEQSFQYLMPLLKKLEFGEKEYRGFKTHAMNRGTLLFATPFDEPSVDFVSRVLNPPIYKVASADLTNTPLLERLTKTGKTLILSTGMSNLDEIDETAAFLIKHWVPFALLHCQSTYPAPADALNLAMIPEFSRRYRVPIGYSGHELGLDHTISAVALGACIVERHITFDKNAPGPDHSASLLPEEFKEMTRRIREFETARGVAIKRISRGEVANMPTLRKSLVAAKNIAKGQSILREAVTAKSPGTGLSPQRLYDLIGTAARRDFKIDDMFTDEDLYGPAAYNMPESFSSKWGLKARYFEIDRLLQFKPRPKLLEFHVSDKDLDFKFNTTKKYPFELVTHAPEYYGTDVIDLGAEDERLREQSIKIMQRTIDQTRAIEKCFVGDKPPKIVIHVGGVTVEKHKNPRRLFERSIASFRRLDAKGVELLPENLPPYGWFFAGQWHCNIFGAAEEMIEFCKTLGLRMCFDTSHAWLYCSHHGLDFLEYAKKVAPYTAYLQISDGRGDLKEGLQIETGDIPFQKTFESLQEHLPEHGRQIGWVPEIWQGHLDDYHEFKIALERLAKYDFLK